MVRHYYVMALFSIVVLFGCSRMIRVDAKSYLQNQAFYEGKKTLIAVDLGDVLEQYELFQGKHIEVTAPVTYFEKKDSPGWFLTLEQNGKKLRCYEDDYRHFVPQNALHLARWAKREGGEVTARGKLKHGGIELNQLSYKTLVVNTKIVPP